MKIGLPDTPHLFSKKFYRITLKSVLNALIITFLIVCLVCVIVGTYIGAYFNPFGYTSKLTLALVNNDDGPYGQIIQRGLLSSPSLGIQTFSTIEDPIGYVNDYQAWGVIIIPQNFSRNINNSLFGQKYTNDPVQVIQEQGRNYSGNRFVIGIFNGTMAAISSAIQVALIANYTSRMNSIDPNLFLNLIPVSFTTLHPVAKFGENVASAFAVTLMCSLALANTLNTLRVYAGLFGSVNVHEIFWLRVGHAILNTFLMSLGISIIVLVFGGNFEKGFGWYWMFTWLFLSAIGAFVGFLMHLCGVYTSIVFPMFLLASYSGAGGAYPLELSPPFFKYGFVLPLYHITRGNRYIMFGTGEIGTAVGVLIAYFIASLFGTYALYLANQTHVEKMRMIRAKKKKDVDAASESESHALVPLDLKSYVPIRRIKGVNSAKTPSK